MLVFNENTDDNVRKLSLAQTVGGLIFDNQAEIKSVRL